MDGWIEIFETRVAPHLFAMGAAYLLALPIGWDREKRQSSAGLRTFPLVALACCGFVQAGERIALGEAEPLARIIEGLITGMGFIGGGAILQQGGSVRGTATAASLWVTGAIGVAVGVGAWEVAILLSLATFRTLRVLQPIKRLALEDSEDGGDGGGD